MSVPEESVRRTEGLERLVAVMEALTADRLDTLAEIYAPEARFVDPFNDVRGVASIRRVFAHGFRQCPGMRFAVLSRGLDGDRGLLRWRMHCGEDESAPVIDGMTEVRLDAEGRVAEHVDHWDPAAQLYERVPLLGWLMRRIRRRLSVPDD